MTIQSHVEAIRGIALAQLVLSPLNVRKVYSESGVAELAELIHTEGVLQNLAGYELPSSAKGRRNKSFAVVAGGRRWRALQLLLSQKRVHSDYIVPFLMTTGLLVGLERHEFHARIFGGDLAFRQRLAEGISGSAVLRQALPHRALPLVFVGHSECMQMFQIELAVPVRLNEFRRDVR